MENNPASRITDEHASHLSRMEEHWSRYPDHPITVEVLGQALTVFPGVFNAAESNTTRALLQALHAIPRGAEVLEMGAGAGFAGILAVTRFGARRTTLVDCTEAAVANCLHNVTVSGLADRFLVLRSDLFDSVPPHASFDVILFNGPWLEHDLHALPPTSNFHRAAVPPGSSFCDPGYRVIRRFYEEAATKLRPGGFILSTFGSAGNRPRLERILTNAGLTADLLSATRDERRGHEYQVLRIGPQREPAAAQG